MLNESKKRLYILIALSAVLVIFLFIFRSEISDIHDLDISMSREPGFYDTEFYLTLDTKADSEIYYTLDGSEPNRDSKKYTEPIYIDDASYHDNVLCEYTDITPCFYPELLAEYSTYESEGYTVPDYNIDKCTILKAVAYDKEGNRGDVRTASFFINKKNSEYYRDLYTVSITTDPDNLFDYDKGIYVMGKGFDDYRQESEWLEHTAERSWNWVVWGANYFNNELRPTANVEIYDANGNLVINQKCDISMKGGSSRSLLPKSFNLDAHKRSDDTERFENSIFIEGENLSGITIFAGGNDNLVNFKDALVSNLISDRDMVTMNYIPCAMFLDGEYWGNYYINEKYDKNFFVERYGVDEKDVLMYKTWFLQLGKEEYSYLYDEFESAGAGLGGDDYYDAMCQVIDMQSFVDYYATEIYISRMSDWPISNFAKWRTVKDEGTEYGDGRWRYILYDVNTESLEYKDIEEDIIQICKDNDNIFRPLCKSDKFKKQFTNTMMDLANSNFSRESYEPVISNIRESWVPAMTNAARRFYNDYRVDDINAVVDDTEKFLDNRKSYIIDNLKEQFGLHESYELYVEPSLYGQIMVNTITVDNSKEWEGTYFTDYDIVLKAQPDEGYQFDKWIIDGKEYYDEELVIAFDNDANVKVIFK